MVCFYPLTSDDKHISVMMVFVGKVSEGWDLVAVAHQHEIGHYLKIQWALQDMFVPHVPRQIPPWSQWRYPFRPMGDIPGLRGFQPNVWMPGRDSTCTLRRKSEEKNIVALHRVMPSPPLTGDCVAKLALLVMVT